MIELCDVCKRDTGKATFYRDDCTLCQFCYNSFYMDGDYNGHVFKDKQTGKISILNSRDPEERLAQIALLEKEVLSKSKGSDDSPQFLEDYLGSDFTHQYTENDIGLVQCSNCRIFTPKEHAYLFGMHAAYIIDDKCKTQVMCDDCYEILQLDIAELQQDDAIKTITVGQLVHTI